MYRTAKNVFFKLVNYITHNTRKDGFLHAILRQNYTEILTGDDV